MYEKTTGHPAESEHILVSKEMANALMSRFGELQQNEALSVIRQMFVERRQENIKEVEERMKFLQDSLARLQ